MEAVVVGAGVFGTWTAHHLRAAGARVTLIDAYGPGNSRSSSGDETRILRCGYGRETAYSEMALASLPQWRELEARLGVPREPIWHPCGVLWMTRAVDEAFAATRETLERGPYAVELLDREALRRRVPQFRVDDVEAALLEPTCGVLMARRAVRALAAALEGDGVRIVRGRVVPAGASFGRAVRLADGSEVAGDLVVFACGAWLPNVLPDVLDGLIRPTRQVVVYFGTPAGDVRFGPEQMPAWIDSPSGIYGTPEIDGRGVKLGIHEPGPPMDPDTDNRVPDPATVQQMREWLSIRMPDLAAAPVIESRVCQYENTDTGDLVIDRHPAHEHVWIVGGGSGHGFKHGPAVGQLAARLMVTGGQPPDRFALATRTTHVRRAVY